MPSKTVQADGRVNGAGSRRLHPRPIVRSDAGPHPAESVPVGSIAVGRRRAGRWTGSGLPRRRVRDGDVRGLAGGHVGHGTRPSQRTGSAAVLDRRIRYRRRRRVRDCARQRTATARARCRPDRRTKGADPAHARRGRGARGGAGDHSADGSADWYAEQRLAAARSGDWQERSDAIGELALERSARGYGVLHDIATNRAGEVDARTQAVSALAEFPEAKDTLLALADDPAPQIQAAAGASLLLFADDPRAWAVIERLVLDERASVREPMQSALRYGRMQQAAVDKRTRLLERIARGGRPSEALAAAAEIGTSGFETAMAVLEDSSKDDTTRLQAIGVLGRIRDPRATARLHQIVLGRVEPGVRGGGERGGISTGGRRGDREDPRLRTGRGVARRRTRWSERRCSTRVTS